MVKVVDAECFHFIMLTLKCPAKILLSCYVMINMLIMSCDEIYANDVMCL